MTLIPTPTQSPAASLRRLTLGDAPDVLEAFQSSADMARQGSVTTALEAERYIARLIDPSPDAEAWAVAVDGKLVGLVCVNVDQNNLNGWFSYWMSASARGQDITARAAATVANWALTNRGLQRLELGHRVNNPSSGAVARKAGFIHEGTERAKFLIGGERIDVLTYGRIHSDPTPTFAPVPMFEQ